MEHMKVHINVNPGTKINKLQYEENSDYSSDSSDCSSSSDERIKRKVKY